MAKGPSSPRPLADVAGELLDPVLRKRAGISLGLVQSWEEIVGPRLAMRSRPEKLQWPRRTSDDEPFRAAVLVVACEGAAALHLQHETGTIISRVNDFLGFGAVNRIRIVQKPVAVPQAPRRIAPRALSEGERRSVDSMTASVEDEGLRDALRRLGASVLASGGKRPSGG